MSRNHHQSASLIVNYIRLIIVMSVFYCFFDNTTRSHNTDNICCTSTVLPLYWCYIRNIPVSYLSAPVCITRHYDHIWHLHRYNTITQHTNELDNLSPSAPKLLLGDFNGCSLRTYIPTYKQYVTCTTRENKTIDLCY